MKLLALVLLASTAHAASLEDVTLLEVRPEAGQVRLKLHTDKGPKGSFFFVTVTKKDPDSFDKLALVLKKLEDKSRFRLDLSIPSFSPSPSGSSYESGYVKFSGGGKR